MAKRINVRYIGDSHYIDVRTIPIGTEFKGVVAGDNKVLIRGSNLAKACGIKGKFPYKQYLFVMGRDNSEFEVINDGGSGA